MGLPDHLTCLLRNIYAGQKATVRTAHETTEWFQIGKGVRQGCILSPCLFNLNAGYIMQNARLDEAQAGIKTAGRNINNLRYAEGIPGGSEVKASACNAGDSGLIPGLGRSPGEGNGNPLQYSCLENPMDGLPCRLQSMGLLESDTTERRHFHFSLLRIGEGHGNPLQCSCLENPRDGGAW